MSLSLTKVQVVDAGKRWRSDVRVRVEHDVVALHRRIQRPASHESVTVRNEHVVRHAEPPVVRERGRNEEPSPAVVGEVVPRDSNAMDEQVGAHRERVAPVVGNRVVGRSDISNQRADGHVESAAAVVASRDGDCQVLSSRIASQVEEHARWGGAVPEIASRRHVEALPVLVETVMAETGVTVGDLDAVAATVAPGLLGALLVGSVTGRTLARLAGVPFLGIHHLEGHLCSALVGEPPPQPPLLVLLVSGGHTELIALRQLGQYQRLAGSRDDAAGEAVFFHVGVLETGAAEVEKGRVLAVWRAGIRGNIDDAVAGDGAGVRRRRRGYANTSLSSWCQKEPGRSCEKRLPSLQETLRKKRRKA